MLLILLLAQVTDLGGRDMTVQEPSLLGGLYSEGRILTVTRGGRISPSPDGVEVRAQTVVLDGGIDGSASGTILSAGSLEGGRYPVLLAPAHGAILSQSPVLDWYPVTGDTLIEYRLIVRDEQGNVVADVTKWHPTQAGPFPLPDGSYTWSVTAQSSSLSPGWMTSPSEVFSFTLISPQPPPVPGPISLVGDYDGDGVLQDPTPSVVFDPVPGADGYDVDLLDGTGQPVSCAGGHTSVPVYTVPGDCPLPDGTYTILIQPVDSTGSPVGGPLTETFVINTTTPTPPIDPDPGVPVVADFPFGQPSGLPGWETTSSDTEVRWGEDATPADVPGGAFHTPPFSLNYNNGADYKTPGRSNFGSARSPAISLAKVEDPRIRFWDNYDTRDPGTSYDQRWVLIRDQHGVVVFSLQLSMSPGSVEAGPCAAPGVWHPHEIPLKREWGAISIELSFDSVDEPEVSLGGWFVDDLQLVGTPEVGPPPPPTQPSPPASSSAGGRGRKKNKCFASTFGVVEKDGPPASGAPAMFLAILVVSALAAASRLARVRS